MIPPAKRFFATKAHGPARLSSTLRLRPEGSSPKSAVGPAIIALLIILGAAPTTRPTPAIPKWLADLADKDQSVRSAARINLMNLTREQLPELLEAAKQARPLLPSQSSALREIVMQAFLSGEPYEKQNVGFIGTGNMDDTLVSVDGLPREGVLVGTRVPGFPAYIYLVDGDILVGVDEFSPDSLDRVHFVEYVKKTEPGNVLTLRVFRQSRVIPIRVTLSARPPGDEDAVISMMKSWRMKESVYWQKNFAPVVDETGETAREN